MPIIENMDVEFKELDRIKKTLPASVPKEVEAFANTEGGELYIGIRNDGSVAGVDAPDDVMTKLSNTIRDTILPDVMPFVQIRTIEMEGKYVVKVSVSVGTERPYYLAKEGLKPRGVHVRRGSACIPVNEAGIRSMIMETSGKSYEECRSFNQELTFETMEHEMKIRNLEFGPVQLGTLKMIGSDGLYTNLALLLSDQCPPTIKVAIFQGKDNAVFRDRKEFTGSLLKQLNEAYQFLDFYNKTEARFQGLLRSDLRDYPEDAVREALLNSIIHRDYLFSGSTIINMSDDRLEFISLGGLLMGLSMEAIFMGISQSRNPNLAAVFYRMRLVESYGTGVRKIKRLYNDCSEKPVFRTAEGAFTVTLPNRNEVARSEILRNKVKGYSVINHENKGDVTNLSGRKENMEYVTDIPKTEKVQDGTANISKAKKVKADEISILNAKERIYQLAVEQGSVTRKDVENVLGFKTTKAFRILKEMCTSGILNQHNQGKLTYYVPN